MKKTFSVLAAALALYGCSIEMEETTPQIEGVAVQTTATENGIICIATGVYPQISNLPSRQIEVNINAIFDAYLREIESDISACPALMSDLVVEGSELTDSTNISFSVKRLDDTYASIVLVRSQYFEGAAHPNNSITTYTFSLRDGQTIALSELFTDSTKAEELLTQKINDQLVVDGMESSYPSETSNGLGAYYLTNTDLVLVDLFGVHAMQGYEVAIPFTELSTVLNPDAI